MRASRTVLLVAFLLVAGTLSAQEAAAPSTASPAKPDYSRDNLLRLLVETEKPEHEPRVRFRFGTIDFKALGTRWRIGYLPFMMPLSGSQIRVTQEWPDPFALTGTSIASPPRVWKSTPRAVRRELRRIDRLSKVKASVKVDGE